MTAVENEAGVLVLGMHRSGTSAVTRAINLLGVPVCRTDDLFEGDGNNTTGYWESRTMMQFNNELLSALGHSWRCPPPAVAMSRRHFDREAAVGTTLLHQSHPTPQWIWKDPRNCALVPFWRRALALPLVAVTVLRHPVEVATSLQTQRERVPRDEALALWERSLRLVLRDCDGMAMLVTRFDELVADPDAWASGVGRFLADHGVRISPETAELRSFLDHSLRHHHVAQRGIDPASGATSEQATLWEAALGLVGPHDLYRAPALPAESVSTGPLLERNLLKQPRRTAVSWYRILRRYGLVSHQADARVRTG